MKRMLQDWFEVWQAEPGLYVIAEPRHFEDVRSYLLTGNERALLVDTGMGIGDIRAVAEELTSLPLLVVNSHAHWDHVGGNWRFDEIWIHEAEAADLERGRPHDELRAWLTPEHFPGGTPAWLDLDRLEIKPSRATRTLRGGEVIDLGGCELQAIHAPGHSPGGLVFVDHERRFMLSTDVAYAAPLYCYGPGTDPMVYRDTLATLEEIAASMRAVYPSHNETPIPPEMIGQMRAGFDEILTGRRADALLDGRAVHRFDGFSIVVRAELAR